MGLVLLFIEGFLIPGFGIAGIAGIVVFLWGLYELLIPDIPVSHDIYSRALDGLTIGIIGGIIALVLLFRLMIKTKFWNKLTSPGVESKDAGYTISMGLEDWVGKSGKTVTDLRPSGWINIDNQKIFVVTEGEFLEKNQPVKILSVDGNRVIVRLNLNEK